MSLQSLNPANNRLYAGAEFWITAMELTENEETAVRNCVTRYSMPSTFNGFLSWLAFRVKNAVLSISGKSEWIVTAKMIQNNLANKMIRTIDNHRDDNEILVVAGIFLSTIGPQYLGLCLDAQNNKSTFGEALIQGLQRFPGKVLDENSHRMSLVLGTDKMHELLSNFAESLP